jgi:hypothetical protein
MNGNHVAARSRAAAGCGPCGRQLYIPYALGLDGP